MAEIGQAERSFEERLFDLLSTDGWRMQRLLEVKGVADWWIGAGFIRSMVWDHLHGLPPTVPAGDVDVVWFDKVMPDPAIDAAGEARLRSRSPGLDWSVANQARMHLHNGDAPYRSLADALSHWPETATAVAVRVRQDDRLELLAPHGLQDLFSLVVRPTPWFTENPKRSIFERRWREKRWLQRWPRLIVKGA